jgi:hypothetical protein
MAARPITDTERDQVRQLHAAGRGRNEIALELDRSAGIITKIARELGLSFDRAATQAATAAKVADAKARRSRLMLDLLNDAEKLRQQLFAPCKVHAFGGKDNTFAQARLDRPPFRDQRDIVQAVSVAVNASLRLDLHDGDPGVEEARSMIGALAAGLQVAYEQMQGAPDDSAD